MWRFIILFVAIPNLLNAQNLQVPKPVEAMSYTELDTEMQNFSSGEKGCARQLAMAKRRFEIYFQNYPLEHVQFYKTVQSYSSSHFFCGETDRAISFLLVNIEKLDRELGKQHQFTLKLLNYLSDLYAKTGAYRKALDYALEAKKRCTNENFLEKYHYESTFSLMKRYYEMGLYEQALVLLPSKLKTVEAYSMPHKYVNQIKFLANLYREIGQYENAYPFYMESLKVLENSTKKPNLGQFKLDLGIFYRRSGQYEKAISALLESAEIMKAKVGENSGWYGKVMNALGDTYRAIGDNEKAIVCFEKAHFNYQNDYDPNHPFCSYFLKDIAAAQSNLGDYEEALVNYEEALEIAANSIGKEHPNYAKIINSLGTSYFDQKIFAEALPLYKEAENIAIASLGASHPDLGKYAFDLATTLEILDQEQESALVFQRGLGNAHLRLQQQFDYFSEQEQTALLGTFQHQIEQFQSFAIRNKNHTELTSDCYNSILMYKGLQLQDRKRLVEAVRNNNNPEIQEKFIEWEEVKKQLARQYTMPAEQRLNDFDQLEQLANQLESELARASQQFKNSRNTVEWAAIQAKLKEGEAAIEFAHYSYFPKGKRITSDSIIYAAYLLKKDTKQPKQIFLFEEKQLGSLRATMRLYNFQQRGNRANLNTLIWKALEPHLADVQTLYFAPSGLLHYINFGAIPISEEATISDVYELHELGSTRQLLHVKESTRLLAQNALLYGGIQYVSSAEDIPFTTAEIESKEETLFAANTLGNAYRDFRGKDWTYLDWTEKEVENLEDHFLANGVEPTVLKEFEATETSFKEIGQTELSPQVLHLATHGFFFPDPQKQKRKSNIQSTYSAFQDSKHPMIRSGLILAGANRVWKGGSPLPGEEDGILTAYEIAQMDLSNTELVVLSACNTGMGDIKGHEGVYGLQRAFKLAGAKYLLMSLWSVPDRQTHEFMNLFYDCWLNGGTTIPAAYQFAQNEMRKRYTKPFDPSAWAGFILLE